MAFTQTEQGLGFVASVQTDNEETFEVVPQEPNLLRVDLDFLQYHFQGHGPVRINNPSDGVVHLVTLQDGQIVIEQVPIG